MNLSGEKMEKNDLMVAGLVLLLFLFIAVPFIFVLFHLNDDHIKNQNVTQTAVI